MPRQPPSLSVSKIGAIGLPSHMAWTLKPEITKIELIQKSADIGEHRLRHIETEQHANDKQHKHTNVDAHQ